MGIERADLYPRATEHIDDMIKLIQTLIEKGHAYEVDGSVYYDVTTFPGYGKLSGNTLDQLRAGHRQEVAVDPTKRHPEDFALWKKAGPNRALKWPSPWGDGYPGWHIECSAMSMKHLGDRFDVHTGGNDNKFPHHEDEIAQSEARRRSPGRLDLGARRVPADERAEDGQVREEHLPRDRPRGARGRSARVPAAVLRHPLPERDGLQLGGARGPEPAARRPPPAGWPTWAPGTDERVRRRRRPSTGASGRRSPTTSTCPERSWC